MWRWAESDVFVYITQTHYTLTLVFTQELLFQSGQILVFAHPADRRPFDQLLKYTLPFSSAQGLFSEDKAQFTETCNCCGPCPALQADEAMVQTTQSVSAHNLQFHLSDFSSQNIRWLTWNLAWLKEVWEWLRSGATDEHAGMDQSLTRTVYLKWFH